MKKSMMSAIILMTIIILMASFDFSLDGSAPITVPDDLRGGVLFICPAASGFWDWMAMGFGPFTRYLVMGFFFAAIVLAFMWGWALYQNLLKDSFNKDAFSKPWAFTKMLFWTAVVVILVLNTPNRYREVAVSGNSGNWVLCENTSPGARVVNANLVHSK